MRGFVFGRAGPVTPSGSLLGSAKELIFNNDFIFNHFVRSEVERCVLLRLR